MLSSNCFPYSFYTNSKRAQIGRFAEMHSLFSFYEIFCLSADLVLDDVEGFVAEDVLNLAGVGACGLFAYSEGDEELGDYIMALVDLVCHLCTELG